MKAILKSVKSLDGKTLWEALYLDGFKAIENYSLEEESLKKAFDISDDDFIIYPVFERRVDQIMNLFPDQEDFAYLIEPMTPINPGQKVYVDDYKDDQFTIDGGWVTVKDIYSTPSTNLVWEKQIVDPNYQNQLWFTCAQIPGVFYWNRLKDLQKDLEKKYRNKTAELKENQSS